MDIKINFDEINVEDIDDELFTVKLVAVKGDKGDKGDPGEKGKDATINGTNTLTITTSGDITGTQSGDTYTLSVTTPKKTSDLSNDSDFITSTANNLVYYYLKSDTYTKQEVNTLIGQIQNVSIEVVQQLPSAGQSNVIYLVPKEGSTPDVYNEYLYINNTWELIGNTQIDLSGYATKDDIKVTLSGQTFTTSQAFADTLMQEIGNAFEDIYTDLSAKQTKSNIDQTIGSGAAQDRYPSSKAVYDSQAAQDTLISQNASDIDQLEARVEKAEMVYNAIPKVTGTGTEYTLEDTAEAPMEIEVGSNTYQYSTTGKNLCPNNLTSGNQSGITWVVNDDGTIKLTGTASARVEPVLFQDNNNPITFEAGTYKNTSNRLMIMYAGGYISIDAGTTVTLSENKDVTKIYFRIENGETNLNEVFYPQIIKSTSTTSYEPYTGANPSPSPSYPQTIQVVTGNNSIKLQNKNLLNISNMGIGSLTNGNVIPSDKTRINNGNHPIKVLPNTKYTFSVVLSNEVKGVRVGVHSCDINGAFLTDSGWKQLVPNSYTITTSSDTHYLKFVFSLSTTSNTVTTGGTESTTTYNNVSDWLRGIKLQVEKNSTATTYYDYNEIIYPLTLGNIEYCKIGDYKDRIFKNVVGDVDYDSSKELGKWYLKKNIAKVVLDGTENDWDERTNSNNVKQFYCSTTATNVVLNSQLCNYGKFKTSVFNFGAVGDFGILNNTNKFYICVDSNAVLSSFKTTISSNNIIAYYPLTTPTYTLLDSTLQTELDNISNAIGYQEQTNISQTNADLPAIINASAVMDLNSLVTRVATLEAE